MLVGILRWWFRLKQRQELEQRRHRLRELAPWEQELPPPSSPQQLVSETGLVTNSFLSKLFTIKGHLKSFFVKTHHP